MLSSSASEGAAITENSNNSSVVVSDVEATKIDSITNLHLQSIVNLDKYIFFSNWGNLIFLMVFHLNLSFVFLSVVSFFSGFFFFLFEMHWRWILLLLWMVLGGCMVSNVYLFFLDFFVLCFYQRISLNTRQVVLDREYLWILNVSNMWIFSTISIIC